jgi:hypothetical protein
MRLHKPTLFKAPFTYIHTYDAKREGEEEREKGEIPNILKRSPSP